MKTYHTIYACLVILSEFNFSMTSDINKTSSTDFLKKISGRSLTNNGVKIVTTCSNNPEEEMTTIELIKNAGYPAENHFVTTDDGYILNLHRIPGDPGSAAVLLHHGLGDSSFTWIATGKKRAIAYELADRGYDVWMANARGNTYSKNHTTLTHTDPEFWNFSYHEVGVYDLPAEIDYIKSIKNDNRKIMYMGVSMGTTVFFVMASQRPDVGSKVATMFALAPVAYVHHIKGLLKLVEPPVRSIKDELNLDGKQEFGRKSLSKTYGKCVCNRPILNELCQDLLFSMAGFNPKGFNKKLLPMLLSHVPAGTSVKTIFHYGFGIRSNKFRQYEYDAKTNLKIYNSTTPPDYQLKNIQVPVALFYGENDFLAQPQDVKRLYRELPNKIELYKIKDPNFNHLDFIVGNDAPNLLHPRLFYLMEKYKSLNF